MAEDKKERTEWVAKTLTESGALLAEGFEEAFVGLFRRFGQNPIALYDYDKCILILMEKDSMSYEEATEHFEVNVIGTWAGEGTPGFAILS